MLKVIIKIYNFADFEEVIIKISHFADSPEREKPNIFFFFLFYYIIMAKPTEYKLRKTAKRKGIIGY